jgi:uncharacterized OB-fold protein
MTMAEKRPDRTLGGPHSEFWDWCAKGELRLQRCAACGQLSWPPIEACQHCGGGNLAWERMSGRGRIASWCTFERDYYGGMLPIPWDTILVELEEGPLFLSNPHGFTWREIEIGMPVTLAFIPCEDSNGAFSLPVFARVSSEG